MFLQATRYECAEVSRHQNKKVTLVHLDPFARRHVRYLYFVLSLCAPIQYFTLSESSHGIQ